MAWRAQPHEAFLGILLRGAVGSVLAGSVYAVAITGRAQPAPTAAVLDHETEDETPIGRNPCDREGPLDVHVLRPRVKLDYLSSRLDGRIWKAVGLPCRGATDRTSCEAAILKADAARSQHGSYLLGTRGDSVLTWAGPEELLALVGRIDDVPTAIEYLRSKRIEHLMCPVQQVADGFLFETSETKQVEPYDARYDVETGIRRRLHLAPDGTLTVRSTHAFQERVNNRVIEGRRPPGLVSSSACVGGLGAHFARAARDEAASVDAFTILAAELRAHGAPAELARRCEAAADEEVRHAAQMSRLARRFGHEPLRATLESVPLRSLRDLAFDNAVEGCVHETYAALIAVYQARCAVDPVVAFELSMIAKDETGHAALSWDIDVWLRSRLTRELQTAVSRAQREAVRGLVKKRDLIEDEGERQLAELPSRVHCQHMIGSVAPHLWSA